MSGDGSAASASSERASRAPSRDRRARAAQLLDELQVEPDDQSTKHDLRLLGRLWPYLRPHRLLMITSILLVPITSLSALLQPYLIKHTVDAVLIESGTFPWPMLVGGYALSVLIEFTARFAQTYAMQLAGGRSMVDLRRAVFRHAVRLRIGFYDRTPIGRVLTRVTNDIDALGELFASGAIMAVADIAMLVGVVAFMLALDLKLSLVALAVMPPLALTVEIIRRAARRAFRDIRAAVAQLNGYLSEQVQGMQVVQAFGREAACADEYALINDAHRVANYRAIRADAVLYSVVEGASAAAIALVLLYAGKRLALLPEGTEPALYVGTVVAFQQYLHQFFIPIRDLSTKYTIVQSSLAAAERVFALLDQNEIEPQLAAPAPVAVSVTAPGTAPAEESAETARSIRFEHVDFGYRPGLQVLHDLSFEVRPGETVAVVGPTGAGKTSIISLLLGFYDIESGSVLVGGREIRSLPRKALRDQLSVVPQDVYLFAGTVVENVSLSSQPDSERVEDVLRRVGALDLVRSREGGLQARVEERGSNFSAGERQLIAFARALYRDAPLLVLDEATAHIDSDTEAKLQAAVLELLRGRTSLVIAHRLSTVRRANRILVLNKGKIVEQGTHEELIALGRTYARLYRLQLEQHGTGP